jgi:glycosyltransferase involved in cell wall biosynthesis
MTAIGNVGNAAQAASGMRDARSATTTLSAPRLSVVIPAYNEEDGIAAIVERVLRVMPTLQQVGVADAELIVVDDGSRDRTAEIVRGYHEVRLIRHVRNRNYGGALKTGFRHAHGDLLAFLDADGTYPPEFLPQMCRAAIDGAEMVVGSRMAGERNDSPAVRKFGNFIFAQLVSLMGDRRVTDVASGMRVFRREILTRLYPLPDGLNFTPAMSTRAMHEGVRVVELPIPHAERLGRSKLGVLRDGWRFFSSIMWETLPYNPARIFGVCGAAALFVAAILAVIVLGLRLSGATVLGPGGMLALQGAIVCAVAGVSVFTLGMTFNYLVSLFHGRRVRRGIFGRPILSRPLEHEFWWMGGAAMAVGAASSVVVAVFAYDGWPLERAWFWLACAGMSFLVGLQLTASWFVMRTLESLSARGGLTARDLHGSGDDGVEHA